MNKETTLLNLLDDLTNEEAIEVVKRMLEKLFPSKKRPAKINTITNLKSRFEARVTQTRVAELAGITVGQLNNIMNGRRKLKPDVEEKIYKAYDKAWEETKR